MACPVPVQESVAEIPLRNRAGGVVAYAIVDAEDFDRLTKRRWSLHSKGYARRGIRVDGKSVCALMHREVPGLSADDKRQVDHIDHDRLNNTKANLRLVDATGNGENRRGSNHGARSSYRNVYWDKANQRWRAAARNRGGQVHIGYFKTEEGAAEAAAAWREEHMPFSTN